MDNKLILNLRIEECDQRANFSLMNLIFRKLQQLDRSGIDVEYFELRLHPHEDLPDHKEIYLKIDANGRTYTDTEVSLRWDDAIRTSCDRLKNEFLAKAII